MYLASASPDDVGTQGTVISDALKMSYSAFNPKEKKILHQSNIEGTINVVNACLNASIEKLIHVSSVATLDKKNNGLITEKMNATSDNNSEYGKTKYLAEMEVWRGIGEGLNAVIVNPSIILGAGNWDNGSTGIFKSAYNEFPWYTNGSNGFVDVVDIAIAMILLMNSNVSKEKFILSGWNLEYKKVFAEIAKSFNKKQPHKKVTPLLAALVWRIEKIKNIVISSNPLLTRETAASRILRWRKLYRRARGPVSVVVRECPEGETSCASR